jgi:uncharacterized protein (DUF2267 family)
MDYQEFIDDIKVLDFIKDDNTADAAIKAVLGIMAGSIKEEDAKFITGALPEPLRYQKLRGHRKQMTAVTFEQCISRIAQEFDMNESRARILTDTVLRSTRAALGGDRLGQVEEILPESWRDAIEHA